MPTESFFSQASLALIASGGAEKDGKVYSIKPTDGTGDFAFSRGSNLAATRVGPTGLIEKGRENLLLQSNNFDTTWATSNASVTSGQSGYDGSSDAWLLESASAGGSYVVQNVSTSGVVSFSVYAKANSSNFLNLNLTGGTYFAWFDLSTGATGTINGASIDSSIESVGAGWYRCTIVTEGSNTSFRIYPTDVNGSTSSAAGNSIYIQDAQLEISLAATEVIVSGATTGKAGLLEDTLRFDYSGGATCPSLLLEPSRTNLVKSEYFGDSTYLKSNITLEGFYTSPSGLVDSYKVLETATNTDHRINSSYIGGINTGDFVTYSVFAKYSGRQWLLLLNTFGSLTLRAYFDVENGTIGTLDSGVTADIEDYGNGWYRCSMTAQSDAAGGRLRIHLSNVDGGFSYLGDITKGIYLWGAQVESGSYATSYIPNHSGGTITRGDESYSKTFTTGLNTNAGTMYFEVDLPQGREGANNIIQLNGASTLGWKGASSNVPILQLNGGGTISDSGFFNLSEGTHKILFRWTNGLGEIFIDGAKEASTITDSAAPSTFTGITALGNAYRVFQKQILLFPTALSDADCITLTT